MLRSDALRRLRRPVVLALLCCVGAACSPGGPAVEAPAEASAPVQVAATEGSTTPGAAPEPPTAPVESGSASGSEAELGLHDGSGAALNPPAAPDVLVQAVRPDDLLRFVAPGAWAVVMVDTAALRQMFALSELAPIMVDPDRQAQALGRAIGGALPAETLGVFVDRIRVDRSTRAVVALFPGERSLVMLDSDAVEAAPTDGAQPVPLATSLRLAVREGVALLGDAGLVQSAVTFSTSQPSAAASTWELVLGDAPAGAVATLAVADWTAIPESWGGVPDLLTSAGAHSTVVNLLPTGELELRTAATNPQSISAAMGRARGFVGLAAAQLQREWAPELAPLLAWLNRVAQASFAHVQLELTDASARIVLPGPACGTWLRNIPVALFVVGAVTAAANDEATPDMPWSQPEAPLSGACASGELPAAQLPVSLASLAQQVGPGEPAMLVLFDLAGALREGLPTAFGFLPSALNTDELVAAMGSSPFGFRGLNDTDGQGAFWFRPLTQDTSLVLHAGADRLWPADQPLNGQTMVTLTSGRRAWTTDVPGTELRLRDAESSDFVTMMSQLPISSWLVVAATPSMLQPLLAGAVDSELVRALEGSLLVSLSFTTADGPSLSFMGTPETVDDATLLAGMPGLLTSLALSGGTTTPAEAARAIELNEWIQLFTQSLVVERQGSLIRMYWPEGGWVRASVLGLATGAPLLGGSLQAPGLDGLGAQVESRLRAMADERLGGRRMPGTPAAEADAGP